MALLSDKNVLWSQLFYQTGVKFGKFYVSLQRLFVRKSVNHEKIYI